MPLRKARNSVAQREVRATQRYRLLRRCLRVLRLICLRAVMRPATSPIYSLLVVKTTVSLARDVTKRTAETQDSEAADTQAGSAEVMKSRLGEVPHRLWTTAETLVAAAMTGEAGMTATAGTVDAIDVQEEKTNTLDAHCRMCKAPLAAAVQFKANLRLHPRLLARHPRQNGSAALRAVTTSPSTTDAAAAAAEAAATSEARGVKTTATAEAVGLAAKTTSCSRRERTAGNAGTMKGLVDPRQETLIRRGDAAGGR